MKNLNDEPALTGAGLQVLAMAFVNSIIAMLGAFGIIDWAEGQRLALETVLDTGIALGIALWVRRKSTPLSNPTDAKGTPLVPDKTKVVTRGLDDDA